MIDNETIINDTENDTPAPAPAPASEPAPAPEPAPVPAPEPSPAPEPEEPAAPMEVVTVDDLLDRLTGAIQDAAEETEEPEETPQEGEEPAEAPEESFEDVFWGDGEATFQTVDMDTVVEYLETIQQTVDHPALTTPFEDYTVTEALLLLLFLSVFAAACVKMLKGGFAWLR